MNLHPGGPGARTLAELALIAKGPALSKADLNSLLELLNVTVDAFAMCEIADHCGLSVPPLDKIVVHYVLRGEGTIECEHGSYPIRQGAIAIIPRSLAKQINGAGPVAAVINAEASCPLSPGIVKFRACQAEGSTLVLGCASVSAMVGDGLGLFDHLQEPLVERAHDPSLSHLFDTILQELSSGSVGAKPMAEAMMKQVIILLVRRQLKREGLKSPLYLPLLNPQVGKALTFMLTRPQYPHSLDELAALAGMSRSRFSHHFAETYGASPIEYLQSVRLKAAARLLRTSSAPVKCVAAGVGFASRSHFSRAFKEQFGTDPTAFRRAVGTPTQADGSLLSESAPPLTVLA